MRKALAVGVGLSVCLLIALVVVRLFVIGVSVVPQNGMYPTIRAGSVVLSWKRPYARIADVKRGDIVLFKRVQDGRTYLYVWRVIGLPGDKVRTAKDGLAVSGTVVKRELVRDDGERVVFRETVGQASYEIAIAKAPSDLPPDREVEVGRDEIFVMGDNRYDAVDSRY